MVNLSASVQDMIDADPADVWRYVSNPVNQDEWVDGMSESEIVGDGPIGRGTQIRAVYTYGGGTAPVEMTITEFREGRAVGIEAVAGPFPFTALLTLERQGRQTQLTNAMTAGSDHFFTSLMFTLFRPLTKRMMTRQLRKELSQLKTILESDG